MELLGGCVSLSARREGMRLAKGIEEITVRFHMLDGGQLACYATTEDSQGRIGWVCDRAFDPYATSFELVAWFCRRLRAEGALVG